MVSSSEGRIGSPGLSSPFQRDLPRFLWPPQQEVDTGFLTSQPFFLPILCCVTADYPLLPLCGLSHGPGNIPFPGIDTNSPHLPQQRAIFNPGEIFSFTWSNLPSASSFLGDSPPGPNYLPLYTQNDIGN